MNNDLQQVIGYSFKEKHFLEEALTHVSVAGDKKSYERMEFLGDRILSLVIADMLYASFPDEEEGDLAKRHSALVRQESLEIVADKINLKASIRVSSKDTAITGSMIADVMEALFAAMYLDGGFGPPDQFIRKYWQGLLRQEITPPEDGKSALQEWAQARSFALPEYQIIERSGPDHRPNFVVEVRVKDFPPQRGEGLSKQAAEKMAAQTLLKYLKEHHND